MSFMYPTQLYLLQIHPFDTPKLIALVIANISKCCYPSSPVRKMIENCY